MTTPVQLAIVLVASHLLADFVFQSKAMAARKTRPLVLTAHAAVAALIPYLLIGAWWLWQIPAITFASHWLFDFLKIRSRRDTLAVFSVDQLAHAAVIFFLSQWTGLAPPAFRWAAVLGDRFFTTMVIISGAILVTTVSSIVVGYVTRRLQQESRSDESGFPSGGATIGQLERFLVFVLILVGEFQAIGFLVAAKSILRFGELKEDRKEAEYVIIGTMWSLTCALLVSLSVRAVLRLK